MHLYVIFIWKTRERHPMASYGVSFVSAKPNRSFTCVIALLSTIVLYRTAIYRESIVPWKRNYVWDMGFLSLLGSIVGIAHRWFNEWWYNTVLLCCACNVYMPLKCFESLFLFDNTHFLIELNVSKFCSLYIARKMATCMSRNIDLQITSCHVKMNLQ